MESWGTRWRARTITSNRRWRPATASALLLRRLSQHRPAVAATLRRKIGEIPAIRRISNLAVVEILVGDGKAVGALALNPVDGQLISIQSNAVILAAGGLTKLFARNSASANMGGEAYALALWAGAQLIDMEFVQFFPIGHLAPRLVGMDPIMWDPFRYKLGGKLLNGNFDEFVDRYGGADFGKYSATRDVAAYAILKEVEAGRARRMAGLSRLSSYCRTQLRGAFGPVIDRLLANGIDLTKTPSKSDRCALSYGRRARDATCTRESKGFTAPAKRSAVPTAHRLSGNGLPKRWCSANEPFARRCTFDKIAAIGRPIARERSSFKPARAAHSPIGNADFTASRVQSHVGKGGPISYGEKLSAALARIGKCAAFAASSNRWCESISILTTRLVRAPRYAHDGKRSCSQRWRAAKPRRAPARRFFHA